MHNKQTQKALGKPQERACCAYEGRYLVSEVLAEIEPVLNAGAQRDGLLLCLSLL